MAFLASQLTLLVVLAGAVCSATGLPFFEGYYQPAYYYPNLRYSRSAPTGASSYASSGASSSSGTHVAPGPGGSGMFNAFAGNGPANDFGQPGYGYGFPGFSFPPFPNFKPFDFNAFYQQYFQSFQEAQRKAQEAAASGNGVYYEGPGYVVWSTQYPGESGSFFSSFGGSGVGSSNEVGASASGEYSPGGGYGSASVYPGAPQGLDMNFGGGLDDRFGGGAAPVNSVSGSFTPPGGSQFGVFTSSSSHSSNVDGKVTSHKMATVGINDNGKVTTYTAHDP